MSARVPAVLDAAAKFAAAMIGDADMREFFACDPSAFDPLSQVDFFVGAEKRDAADFFQIKANRIVRINIGEVVLIEVRRDL